MVFLSPMVAEVRIEVTTQLEDVKVTQLSLGKDYPAAYKIAEYFPILTHSSLRKMLSSNSILLCSLTQTPNEESGNFELSLNNCKIEVPGQKKIAGVAEIYGAKLCLPQKECAFLSVVRKPSASQTGETHTCTLGKNYMSALNNNANDVIGDDSDKTRNRRVTYFAKKVFLRGIVPFSGPLNSPPHLDEKNLIALIAGGILPTVTSNGQSLSITMALKNVPTLETSGAITLPCLSVGSSEVKIQNAKFSARIVKGFSSVEGEFVFSHRVKIEGREKIAKFAELDK